MFWILVTDNETWNARRHPEEDSGEHFEHSDQICGYSEAPGGVHYYGARGKR
jgi:hypothetical protein